MIYCKRRDISTLFRISEIIHTVWGSEDIDRNKSALSEIQCILKRYYQETTSDNVTKNPEVISDHNDINL